MRKFLIYLTSIITVVCLGLVTYYFIKIDERISMSTKEIYCNVGDVISVDTLGIEIVKPSRKTTFDYTTGVEEIVYDADTNCYVAVSGGNVEIEVKTSNKEYASFKIAVHIGDGEIVPYFVNNEQTLSKMSQYGLNRNYLLMSDIVLTDEFAPIGTDSLGFSGIFDGNGHKISGLKVNSNKEHAGLFTRIEQGGEIKNLQITDFTFNGEFDHVGALAGSCNGTILNVGANGISIVNDKATTVMGGLIGDCTGATIIGACVEDTTINNSSLTTSDSYVGGLIGLVNGEQRSTIVRACYASGVTLDLPSDITTGGLVGKFIVGGTKDSSIQQSYASTTYSNPTTTNYGAFLGEFSANSTLTTIASNDTNQDVTYESLMIRYLVGNLAVVGIDNFADTDLVAKDNFYKDVTSGSKYFDKATGNYYIAGFITNEDLISISYDEKYGFDADDTRDAYLYYDVDGESSYWDTGCVWKLTGNALPTLKVDANMAIGPSSDYYRKLAPTVIISDPTDLVDPTNSTDPTDPTNPTEPISIVGAGRNIILDSDIELPSNWVPGTLTNSTLDGNGHVLTVRIDHTDDNNFAGVYSEINNSTIKNLTIKVLGISTDADGMGVVAAKMANNSNILNVTIDFTNCEFEAISVNYFGGIVGSTTDSINVIDNVKVVNLNINKDATIKEVGALVGRNYVGRIINCEVSAKIYGTQNVGGLVATNGLSNANTSYISGIKGSVEVVGNNVTEGALVAGLVAVNNATVNNISVETTSVKVGTRNGVVSIAGGIAVNNGTFADSNLTGTVVGLSENKGNNLYNTVKIGGIAVSNYGTISNINNYFTTVGSYYSGYNIKVGGVTEENFGEISKVVMSANLQGNYVAGLTVDMKREVSFSWIPNFSNPHVKEVLIAGFDKTTKKTYRNTIFGDKYVAGMVVDFRNGTVEDVQASSKLEGKASNTRTSLIVLAFPQGAKLINSTVSSELAGYGAFYKDTWCDYTSCSDQFSDLNGVYDYAACFNLYAKNNNHGIMQSVVIDSSATGFDKTASYYGSAAVFGLGSSYENNNDSSFIKEVNGFSSATSFQGEFKFVTSTGFLSKCEYSKKLTFNPDYNNSAWTVSTNGITLKFLSSIN